MREAIRVLFLFLLTLSIWAPGAAAQEGQTPDLAALARAVQADNVERGNVTIWRGGQLGHIDAIPQIGYGQKLAGFVLYDASGRPVILDRIAGPKLVNFWASWCGPCISEFPLLAEAEAAGDARFEVIFVNVWDTPEGARAFLDDYPEAPYALMAGDPVSEQVGVVAIPTSLLIDSDGIVHAVHVGDVTPPVLDFLNALALELE
ncbi:MAG: TlpA family protein disulfide reductase [Anaerolineae bacterium]|nr:TlpA family protein disulfide reductase [Anaerolineae bacterium]